MQQVFPTSLNDIKYLQAYTLDLMSDTHLRINMVTSLDGAISIGGTSRRLSSPTDRKAFHAMRSLADVVLVGAGTMRKENYGPTNIGEEDQKARVSRGQQPIPPVAVVTKSADFDFGSDFFTAAVVRPIIVTTESAAKKIGDQKAVADIIGCGESEVDLEEAIAELSSRGFHNILCEGGPSLNADLLKAGVINELCLTVSPMIVQGSGKSMFNGPELSMPANMEVTHIFLDEGDVFLRLRVS